MGADVIPPNHVLRIKREGGKVELELMRFLTINDMKARRPRNVQLDCGNDAATGSAMLRDAIHGMLR